MDHVFATDEYKVIIGDPVVSAEAKATSTSVSFLCEAIPDGDYFISLSVNSTNVAYRELLAFASGSCTVGDYTLSYSSYAVTVSTTSNNDVVRLKIEPVEVKVTDAMKAAVAKVAPVTPNELPDVGTSDKGKFLHANESTGALEWASGGSGGRFVVTFSYDSDTETWSADKTFAECVAAWNAGQTMWAYDDDSMAEISLSDTFMDEGEATEFDFITFFYDDLSVLTLYITSDAAGGNYKYLAPAE